MYKTDETLIADKIKHSNDELPSSILDNINDDLLNYFIVGGMPECVRTFVESKSFIDVIRVQTDLLTTFRQDFSKYAGHSDRRCLNSVLNSVAQSVGEQIKYARLTQDFSNPTIKKAFELLETARLFTKVKASSATGLPISTSSSEKKFKTVFLDIGLMSNICGYYSNKRIPKEKLLAAFNGKMAEQFVGQELKAKDEGNLYHWAREARGSSAEVDQGKLIL